MESDIKNLKANYAKYVIAIYKYGPVDKWNILFNSDSLSQAILRIKYLQKFSEKRQKDLRKAKRKQAETNLVRDRLKKGKKGKGKICRTKRK